MTSRAPKIGLYQPYPHTLGGLQTVLLQLAKTLPSAGYTPVFIIPEDGKFGEAARAQGFEVLVLDPGQEWHVYGRGARSLTYAFSPTRLLGLVRYWSRLRRDLRRHEISLLHCNDYRGVMLAAPAARLAGIPVIWHMHGFVPSRLANIIAAALVQWTVPVSKGMLDYLKMPKWLLGKYEVIYNGLETLISDQTDAGPSEAVGPTVLAVGTLHPRKGYETLLHAFQQVVRRIPNAECWIVGGDFGDGSHGCELRSLTARLGLERQVKFLGHSSDVNGYMRRCSLLAVPSRIEAFGMVAIEAMLLGKPVVACRTGGLKEIVSHRETGSLVEPGNVAEMSGAIIEILADKPLAQAMGRAGQARVEKSFTLNAMTRSFAQFYGLLLKTT